MMSSIDRRAGKLPFWAIVILGLVAAYTVAAYVILPRFGEWQARRHPDLIDGLRITHTAGGVAGDPLNIALVGAEEDVFRAFAKAGWHPADPLTFQSSIRIVYDTVFKKPDENAPVSNLYLYGRKEDLAFEKPVGDSPRARHHVRLWRTGKSENERPVWVGAATHDVGVELSDRTGQVTHRIAPNLDAERDLLLSDLMQANRLPASRWIEGFHKELQGYNGGGDPWHTDGRLAIAVLSESISSTNTTNTTIP